MISIGGVPGIGRSRLSAVGFIGLIGAATALTVVVQGSHLLPGEPAVARWLAENPLPGTVAVSEALDIGVGVRMAPLIFFALFPIVWRAWGRYAALTFLVAGGLTIVVRLAEFPYRPRPTDDLIWTSAVQGSSGYPSGHVIYSVLVFGIVAFLAYRHARTFWPHAVMVLVPVIIAIAMGPARIIVKDHWPVDVVGGYLISLPLLIAVIWAHAHLPSWLRRHAPASIPCSSANPLARRENARTPCRGTTSDGQSSPLNELARTSPSEGTVRVPGVCF